MILLKLIKQKYSIASKNSKSENRGFSLIEMLVSLSIFIVVIVMAVSALLVLIDANAKAQSMQRVMTNLSFALDSMSREIRTGSGFICADSDINPQNGEFVRQDCSEGDYLSIVEGGDSLTGGTGNSRITYRYNSTNKTVDRRIADGSWYPVTDPKTTVTDMHFSVSDSEVLDGGNESQARVTIYIAGHSGELENVDSSFQLETTIVRRVLDI